MISCNIVSTVNSYEHGASKFYKHVRIKHTKGCPNMLGYKTCLHDALEDVSKYSPTTTAAPL